MSSQWERGVMFYNGKPDLTQYWMTCLERVTYAKDRFCRYMYTNHFSRYKRQNYSIPPPILHTFPVYSFFPIIFVSSLYIVELVLGLNMHAILAARRGRHLYDHIISLISEIWALKISLTHYFLLNCLYQIRKMTRLIFVC